VVTIREDANGQIDITQLEAELIAYQDRPLRIASFSAASNVTGIITDTHAVTQLVHKYGAFSFLGFCRCRTVCGY